MVPSSGATTLQHNATLHSSERNCLTNLANSKSSIFDPTIQTIDRSIDHSYFFSIKVVAPHESWTISPSPQSPRFYLPVCTHAILRALHRSSQCSISTVKPLQHGLKTRLATLRCPAAVYVRWCRASYLPNPTLYSGPERYQRFRSTSRSTGYHFRLNPTIGTHDRYPARHRCLPSTGQ